MSTRSHARHNRRRPPKSRNSWWPLFTAAVVAIAVLAGGLWFLAGDGGGDTTDDATAEAAVPLPIANTPQTVLGLQVDQPAVDRGRLPLNTAVTQVYEIENTGAGVAEFGKPTIEVLDGCCPPQVQMSHPMIAAGEKASVGFSTQMHEGMDGPHLFHVTVPVRTAEGEDALHLYFKGDFRG